MPLPSPLTVLRWVTRAEGNTPLRRGFKEEANALEGMPSFSDLILVVHGNLSIKIIINFFEFQ